MKTKLFFSIVLLFFSLSAFALKEGETVPDFSAKNQNGKIKKLSDFRGQNVLIYFYPKDQTSGCTKQAQDLRDQFAEFKKMNTVILGVSRQDEKSHLDFATKEKLPFDLLVDSDGAIGKLLGVESIPLVGLSKRQSLLVDTKGHLVKFYKDVDPALHASLILDDLRKNSAASESVKIPKTGP